MDLCAACGLVVNPRWPWLEASPDALVSDAREEPLYGAVEVKCPASKYGKSIVEACGDKSFCLEFVKGKPCPKKKHIYYYQCQGVMAICQLNFIDFVVKSCLPISMAADFNKIWVVCSLSIPHWQLAFFVTVGFVMLFTILWG